MRLRRDDPDDVSGPMSVPEVARQLDMSERKVRYLLRNGDLRGEKEGGRWQISRRSVGELRRKQERERWEGVHEHRVGRERSRYRERA